MRNSEEFALFARSHVLSQGETLVSFDVVSLFMNVPVQLACSVAKVRLLQDATLSDCIALSPSEVVTLL